MALRVISVQDLLRAKKDAGRAKDKVDYHELLALHPLPVKSKRPAAPRQRPEV